MLSAILYTFSFISRPCPLPSFPLLTNPRFCLIQFCFSEITCLLFTVLFKLYFTEKPPGSHLFLSVHAFLEHNTVSSHPLRSWNQSLDPSKCPNSEEGRACVMFNIMSFQSIKEMKNKRLGKDLLTLRNPTFKSPEEPDLWEQTQEVSRDALHCSLRSQAWHRSGLLLLLFTPMPKLMQSLFYGLLCSTVPARRDNPVLREEAGLSVPDCSPSLSSHRQPQQLPSACCHTQHTPPLENWCIPTVPFHLGQTFALLLIFPPTSGGSPTNAWAAELPKMSEHLQQPG